MFIAFVSLNNVGLFRDPIKFSEKIITLAPELKMIFEMLYFCILLHYILGV